MARVVQLELSEQVYVVLSKKADQAGQTVERFASQLLAEATEPLADDPLDQFIGAFDSGGGDWVNQHDIYIGEAALKQPSSTTSTQDG